MLMLLMHISHEKKRESRTYIFKFVGARHLKNVILKFCLKTKDTHREVICTVLRLSVQLSRLYLVHTFCTEKVLVSEIISVI